MTRRGKRCLHGPDDAGMKAEQIRWPRCEFGTNNHFGNEKTAFLPQRSVDHDVQGWYCRLLYLNPSEGTALFLQLPEGTLVTRASW